MAKTKETKTFECTIKPVLFETIKMLRRWQDAKDLVDKTGFSRPVIDKALNYGHIRDAVLDKAIVDFYKAREDWQENAAIELLQKFIKNKKK